MPESDSAPLFTTAQRRLLAFTVGFFALALSGALIVFLIVVLGRLVGFFANVLWPLAVAAILALILRPWVDRLEARLRLPRQLAVLLLYLFFFAAISGLLVAFLPPLISQILDLISYAPDFWTKISAYSKEHYPQWIAVGNRVMNNPAVSGVVESARDQLGKVPAMILPSLKAVSQGAWFAVNVITNLALIPIYLFFFLLSKSDHRKQLPEQLPFLSPSVREDVVFLIQEFVAIIVSFFRGQLVIGFIMGILYATGFSVIGLKFGLFIGLLVGLLNVVPYLGTILGLATTLPLALVQDGGGMHLVMLVIVVKLVVQAIEGWVLTPRIMGHQTGLHPIVIIVAVLFWGTAFEGILGMVLAIPLTAFFVTAWRLVKRKYFPVAAARR